MDGNLSQRHGMQSRKNPSVTVSTTFQLSRKELGWLYNDPAVIQACKEAQQNILQLAQALAAKFALEGELKGENENDGDDEDNENTPKEKKKSTIHTNVTNTLQAPTYLSTACLWK